MKWAPSLFSICFRAGASFVIGLGCCLEPVNYGFLSRSHDFLAKSSSCLKSINGQLLKQTTDNFLLICNWFRRSGNQKSGLPKLVSFFRFFISFYVEILEDSFNYQFISQRTIFGDFIVSKKVISLVNFRNNVFCENRNEIAKNRHLDRSAAFIIILICETILILFCIFQLLEQLMHVE